MHNYLYLLIFSTNIYRFSKNKLGIKKYQYKHCKRQFTLEKPVSKSKSYPKVLFIKKLLIFGINMILIYTSHVVTENVIIHSNYQLN